MSSKFETFRNLHRSADLFLLPNVWDAKSALLFQEQNIPAIATSSAAVAASLGYEDGQGMPFADYLFVISRILASVDIPLSVDMEMGYGDSDAEIIKNVLKLIDMGVVGINLEDSTIDGSGRVLKDARIVARTIENIKDTLAVKGLDLFLNLRCDTFILDVDDKLPESNRRVKLYEAAGADGVFLPCITAEKDIAAVAGNTKLPLNVMCVPGLPGFEVLKKLGVGRVSMGPFLFNKVYDNIGRLSRAIVYNERFSPLFL